MKIELSPIPQVYTQVGCRLHHFMILFLGSGTELSRYVIWMILEHILFSFDLLLLGKLCFSAWPEFQIVRRKFKHYSNGQQFYQYQEEEQSPLVKHKKRDHDMILEIQVLVSARHKNVAVHTWTKNLQICFHSIRLNCTVGVMDVGSTMKLVFVVSPLSTHH